MRKVGDIMDQLGFKKDAPDSVKKAFIKNLIRQAHGAPVEDITSKKAEKKLEQLSFQFNESDKDIA